MQSIHRFGVIEESLQAKGPYGNAFAEVDLGVRLKSPSGRVCEVRGFWDGDATWKFRFSPGETGEWTWTTSCAPGDKGLDGRQGRFECVPYEGDNPLYLHGPLRVSEDGTHLENADGTPFFWMADTAWNGVLRAREGEWDNYLHLRRDQGFNVVQFVTTHWRGLAKDALGARAFAQADDGLRLNPAFFRRLDAKVAAINAHGLLAAPVVLWALMEDDPGNVLSEDDAVAVGRYIVARWGACCVAWFLGGDARFYDHKGGPDRWRRIARGVFPERATSRNAGPAGPPVRGTGTDAVSPETWRPVTIHSQGQAWFGEEFRDEPWYDFVGYQSGHGDSEGNLRWLTEGPPARDWANEPRMPVINLEPNYEAHKSYHSDVRFGEREVRRAAWWSLLVSPPAGVSYGTNPVWNWGEEPAVADGHPALGVIAPWHDQLELPGARCMTVLRRFFQSLPWTRLRPAQQLLNEQPGASGPSRFVAAASTAEGDLAVIYLPVGARLALQAGTLALPLGARWFDPRTGESRDAGTLAQAAAVLDAPDELDWALVLRK